MEKRPKKIEVIAYSGFKAGERPLSFTVEGENVRVKEVLDRWYGLEHDIFKVLGENARVYLLRWHRDQDVWELLSTEVGPVYH